MGRTVQLPSGVEAIVNVAPFKDSNRLFQAISREWKGTTLNLDPKGMTGLFFAALSSIDVEKALWPCLHRCLYNGEKITADTFEPEETREDFMPLCLEVIVDNVLPFMKGLFSPSETQNPAPPNSQPLIEKKTTS